MLVLTFDKLAYLPVTKNASTTFTRHFLRLGWETSQLDMLDDTYEIFGYLREPIERHFKGTAQFLIKHELEHLADDLDWQKIWANAVMDIHSYPVTWCTQYRKIHWIPIHQDTDIVELTRIWLKQRNVDLGEVEWLNESNDELRSLYNKLKNIELKNKQHTLTYFYDADIVLWNKVSRGLQ